MQFRILFAISVLFSTSLSSQDRVAEMFDSLKNVYYYNTIPTSSKHSFIENKNERDKLYGERINILSRNSPFNYVYNSDVELCINRYVKNPKGVSTMIALSQLYFPLYEKYLNQYKIPLELKYLSVVESALNPTARSKCGATGLWQFMYGTAKAYDLEINSYLDERFDPELETIAACKYLLELFNTYKDWSLAIAAYNCGPGNVNKAIKRGGVKDFWQIKKYLPVETQNYVPAFIAASYILTYYKKHNISEANIELLYDDLDFITTSSKISLVEVSKQLDIPLNQLRYLNPKYYIGIVPDNNKIIVPKNKALQWIDFTNGNDPIEEQKITISKKVKEDIKQTADNVSNSISPLVSLKCVVYGDQKLRDGGIVLMRNLEVYRNENTLIPPNSIIKVKTYFKNNSIQFKTISATTINGEILFNLNGDLDLNTNKSVLVNDGLVLIFKS